MKINNKIHLFDLDDTLITTEAKIVVKDEMANVVDKLSSFEWTTYHKKSGQSYDFSDLYNVKHICNAKVVNRTREIINEIKKNPQNRIGILTARGNKKMLFPLIRKFMLTNFGINIKRKFFFAVSDVHFVKNKEKRIIGFAKMSAAEKKSIIVKDEIIDKGFKDINFYDDSQENINSFNKLSSGFDNIKFSSFLIDRG